MTFDQYQAIADNWVNGNLEDFRKSLRKLTKIQLLEFVGVFADYMKDAPNYGNAIGTTHKYLSDSHGK